jgi:hypothetical protein
MTMLEKIKHETELQLAESLVKEVVRFNKCRVRSTKRKSAQCIWKLACDLRWLVNQDFSGVDAIAHQVPPPLSPLASPTQRKEGLNK